MLKSAFTTFDAWRERTEERIDAAVGGSLRAWWQLFAVALVATVGVVAMLRLLLTAMLGAGPVAQWIAASVVALLALVLLIVVVRNVVISLVEPAGHRRSLLVAFLTSAAAVAVSVEAFATITAAMVGAKADLWAIERLYLWHLVDSIPLLDIPGRLEWTEPLALPGIDGRLLVLGFKLVVVPPLVRVAVALYALVENRSSERRYSAAVATKISRREFLPYILPPARLLVLATGAGAVWSVLEPGAGVRMRWFSLTGLALAGTVIAVMVVAVLVIVVLLFVRFLPPVLTLVVAIVVVWLPAGSGERGLWSQIGLTLLVWLVATVSLVFVWDEDELPNALLALVLVLGFVGADAPIARWLIEHMTWTPWDFPLGRAIITASWGMTAAFLAYLVWRVLRRPAVLGTSHWASPARGLREDLRGYALIGVHVVIIATAVLTLLRTVGAVDVRAGVADAGWTSATQSLAAVTWHLADSLPGPNIPQTLAWRLATDFGGPWAGLVIVTVVASFIFFVAFPMIRTMLLWARLTATRPSSAQPLADVPAAILENLQAVVAFLDAWEREAGSRDLFLFRWSPPQGVAGQAEMTMQDAERRLVSSELERLRLLDLLGAKSPIYIAAGLAILVTADAYQTAMRGPSKSRFGPPGTTTAQAREAVEELASLVERQQSPFLAAPKPTASPEATNPTGHLNR